MAEADDILQGDLTDRLTVGVTENANLECSRFCLAKCGLYGDAQGMAMMATMLATQTTEAVSVDFTEDNPRIQTEEGIDLPEIVMSCKGPRKKYWIAGQLVCRKNAEVDTA